MITENLQRLLNECIMLEDGNYFILFNHKTLVAENAGIINGDFYYMFNHLIHPIRHVHQLQNIFYSISGEELELGW